VTFGRVTTAAPKVRGADGTLSATGGSWVVSVSDPTSHCSAAPSASAAPQVVAARAIGEGGAGVSVEARQRDNTNPATSITFNAFGQVANATPIGRVLVNDGTTGNDHRKYRIMISSGGRSIVCDEAVTDSTDPRICPGS